MSWPVVTAILSNPSFTAQVNEDGELDLTGGNGHVTVYHDFGSEDYETVQTNRYDFSGTTTSNGLTLTVASDGLYALSGAWTGTNEVFDIVASRFGYDDVVESFTVTRPEPETSGDQSTGGRGGSEGDSGGGTESDEGRAGENPPTPYQVEYTTEVRVLEDILPATPLIFNGDDLIITLDLRTITYKPSALKEVLDQDFKSY